jgi:hypothetical protein
VVGRTKENEIQVQQIAYRHRQHSHSTRTEGFETREVGEESPHMCPKARSVKFVKQSKDSVIYLLDPEFIY